MEVLAALAEALQIQNYDITYSFMLQLTNSFRRSYRSVSEKNLCSLPLVVGKEITTTAGPLPEGGIRRVHTAKKLLLTDGYVFCFNEDDQAQRFRFSPTSL
jgi:hypothetical protein